MRFTSLSNQVVIISRLVPVSGSGKLAMSTVTASTVSLQPIGLEKTLKFGGVPGALYKIFADSDLDIQEGDQVKDEDENIYTVRKGGVTPFQHGSIDYMEIYLTKS